MATIQKSIDIDVPVSTAYDQWTQFEEFPRFMEHVVEVRQLDDAHLHWVAEIGGEREEWDAEIVEQAPDRVIAWRSTSGAENAGRVEFLPAHDTGTRVTLRLDYAPDGIKESVGSMLGLDARHVEDDLQRFKELVETHGASGGWRGEVAAGEVRRPGAGTTGEPTPTGSVPTGLGTGTSGSGLGATTAEGTSSMPGSQLPGD